MCIGRKKISKAAGIMLMAVMMTGCGEASVPDQIDRPMISIAENGEVTEYLVGEFSAKDYYSISELSSMAAEEAAKYNTANQTGTVPPVRMDRAEALEDGSGRVCIVYQYDSAESYTGFNEGGLFYGTVEEAASLGYATDVSMTRAGGTESSPLTEIQGEQSAGRRLVIAPPGVFVYCPGKVEYISGNAVMAEDGSVDAMEAEGPVYILLK